MNLLGNIFTIECDGVIDKWSELYFISIGEHEVEGFELLHLINRVDEGEGKDYKLVDGVEVSLNLGVVARVDLLGG